MHKKTLLLPLHAQKLSIKWIFQISNYTKHLTKTHFQLFVMYNLFICSENKIKTDFIFICS